MSDDGLHLALGNRFGERFHDVETELRERYATTPRRRRREIELYVLHHSAGAESMEGIWRYHTGTRGWDQGGYAIGIGGDGHVYWAAPPSVVTYGAGPLWNDKCFFIVALGDFEREEPSAEMLGAIYGVLLACDDVLGERPWRGHREIKATACPGKNLFSHLTEMRGGRYGAGRPRKEQYP